MVWKMFKYNFKNKWKGFRHWFNGHHSWEYPSSEQMKKLCPKEDEAKYCTVCKSLRYKRNGMWRII